MVTVLTLDKKGVVAAALLGIAVLLLGRNLGPFFLLDLVLFLALSGLATEIGKREKRSLGLYEAARGWKNVVANGSVPFVLALAYFLSFSYRPDIASFVVIAYISSAAAVTADKYASEIGVMDGTPIMLLTMQKVRKGSSGAVTGLGLLASLLATLVIAVSVFVVYSSAFYFEVVVLAGFAGSLVDSVFGYFEEQGIGNKYTTNVACAIAGALLGAALLLL